MASESAGYITDPEEQPFSPSIFLNLPPTPGHDDDGQDPADDLLVLPFISRILMEEETDDDQHPDNQALLRAQQPFAEILSNTSTNIGPVRLFVSAQPATTQRTGPATNTFTVSPFFPNNVVSAFETATWPYDPVELVQLLSRTPYPGPDSLTMGDANTTFLAKQEIYTSMGHGQHNANKAIIFKDKTTTLISGVGAGVREHNSSHFFGGQMTQIKVTTDMLNQAFLKGMQEANKFLPTNNMLLTHSENISGSREHLSRERQRIIAAGQVKKKGVVVDGIMSSMLQEGSDNIACKKHHNWDNLEVDMGRNMVDLSIAIIAPEPDKDGEKIDKFILIKYQPILNKMMGLSISVDTEAEKNGKKGKRKSIMVMNNEPVVDLRSLLMRCAHAVATENRLGATELLYKIKQHSSPMGDATQRMAYYFAQGLEARLDGMGSQLYKSLMVKLNSANEFIFLMAYQLCLTVSCFKMMAFKFSNVTILKAATGMRKKVHIVDYGDHYGFQWPTLLGHWATWEEEPPMVRITCIVLPNSGIRPAARIEETGRRLNNFACRCGIPFKFRSIVAKWEAVCADDLNIESDEVLIVNALADFGRLMDESVHNIDSLSPRDMVLKNIQKMRPDVFILFIENSSYNTPFFLTRFREALFYHSAVFDMMDAVASRDNNERILFEQNLLGQHALNIIACEGSDRVERHETYKQWQVRNYRAGLRQLSLDPDIVMAVSKEVKDNYSREFVVNVDKQWFLQGWKGRILYALSTWVANDGISSLG